MRSCVCGDDMFNFVLFSQAFPKNNEPALAGRLPLCCPFWTVILRVPPAFVGSKGGDIGNESRVKRARFVLLSSRRLEAFVRFVISLLGK